MKKKIKKKSLLIAKNCRGYKHNLKVFFSVILNWKFIFFIFVVLVTDSLDPDILLVAIPHRPITPQVSVGGAEVRISAMSQKKFQNLKGKK